MKQYLSTFLLLAILHAALLGCVNSANDESDSLLQAPEFPTTAVFLSSDEQEISYGKTTFARASGGSLPYRFSILSGPATIDSSTGEIFQDNASNGVVQIQVTDSIGQSATATIRTYPQFMASPAFQTAYASEVVQLELSGGKAPYNVNPTTGAVSPTWIDNDTVQIIMPATNDTVILTFMDSLFNISVASVQVIPHLRVSQSATVLPTIKSDGSPRYAEFKIRDGLPDSNGEYIVRKITGEGTLEKVDKTTYRFLPDRYKVQTGAAAVKIEFEDSLNEIVTLTVDFFVPLITTSGGLHSCAVDISEGSGKIKCWGDGINGQLGYGDDPYSQPYWGDCTNCNEDSRVSTTNTDNFKTVHFLSKAERDAGGFIVNYDVGTDTNCAIVALSSADTERQIRCLGSNSPPYIDAYTTRSKISINTNRFPFSHYRHPAIRHTDNGIGTSYPGPGRRYRFVTADTYILPTPWGGVGWELFPRTFNPLPSTGPYQTTPATNIANFGLNLSYDASNGEYYQDPSKFDFYSSMNTINWVPEQVVLARTPLHTGTYFNFISHPSRGSHLSKVKNSRPTYINTIPYVSALAADAANSFQSGLGVLQSEISDSMATSTPCALLTDNRVYCVGRTNALAGINDTSSVNNPYNNTLSGNFTANTGSRLPATTLLGGDADAVYGFSHSAPPGTYESGKVCAIFDGNPTVGVEDRIVACWGGEWAAHSNFWANGNTSVLQHYPRPVETAPGVRLTGVKKVVTSNASHACALTFTNQLWCWGGGSDLANTFALTSERTTSQDRAVQISLSGHQVLDFDLNQTAGCAVTLNAGEKFLQCWGTDNFDSYSIPKASPGTHKLSTTIFKASVSDPREVKIASTGGCMLPEHKQHLRCWGDNRTGSLGINNGQRGNKSGDMSSLPYVNLGTGLAVKSVTSGFEHNCAILNNDRLKCWGSNFYGELGISRAVGFGYQTGTNNNTHVPGHGHMGVNENQMGDALPYVSFPGDTTNEVTTVVSNSDHVCAITKSNNLYCWGDNSTGQAGQSGATASTRFFASPQKVNLPPGNLLQIALGAEHTCAMLEENSEKKVYCWGANSRGQLGYGSLTDLLGASAHSNDVVGDQVADIAISNLPPLFFDGYPIKKISAGNLNTCILFENGKARCFGANNYGQIGMGNFDNNNDGLNDDMGLRLADSGYKYLVSVGKNNLTSEPHKIIDLNVGHDFACALLDTEQLKCWGNNLYGQLGLEDRQNRGGSSGDVGDALPYLNLEPGQKVISFSLGTLHSCAVLSSNKIKCWGANFSGQLGIDSDFGRGAYPYTMGVSLPYNKVKVGP